MCPLLNPKQNSHPFWAGWVFAVPAHHVKAYRASIAWAFHPRYCTQPSFALQNYNVISLFLLTNILNASATIPVLMGLWRGKLAHRIITPASVLFGCILGLMSVIVYGVIQAPHWGLSTNEALHTIFLGKLTLPLDNSPKLQWKPNPVFNEQITLCAARNV